jgi:hypothetical protein
MTDVPPDEPWRFRVVDFDEYVKAMVAPPTAAATVVPMKGRHCAGTARRLIPLVAAGQRAITSRPI